MIFHRTERNSQYYSRATLENISRIIIDSCLPPDYGHIENSCFCNPTRIPSNFDNLCAKIDSASNAFWMQRTASFKGWRQVRDAQDLVDCVDAMPSTPV